MSQPRARRTAASLPSIHWPRTDLSDNDRKRITPRAYVEAARVEAAQRLLEDGTVALKKVASLCGFADQAGLRRAYLRRIRVTRLDYRPRFRSTSGR